MYSDNDEEVVTEEPLEDQIETLGKVEYQCTACFDVLTADELGENKDNCPNCKETDCITESYI